MVIKPRQFIKGVVARKEGLTAGEIVKRCHGIYTNETMERVTSRMILGRYLREDNGKIYLPELQG